MGFTASIGFILSILHLQSIQQTLTSTSVVKVMYSYPNTHGGQLLQYLYIDWLKYVSTTMSKFDKNRYHP